MGACFCREFASPPAHMEGMRLICIVLCTFISKYFSSSLPPLIAFLNTLQNFLYVTHGSHKVFSLCILHNWNNRYVGGRGLNLEGGREVVGLCWRKGLQVREWVRRGTAVRAWLWAQACGLRHRRGGRDTVPVVDGRRLLTLSVVREQELRVGPRPIGRGRAAVVRGR